MADERTWLEKEQARSHEYHGRELTSDEVAVQFAKADIHTRAEILSTVKADLPDDMSPREAARRFADIRALDSMHQRLKEVDR